MGEKPKFDPNKPWKAVTPKNGEKPKFDPNKPWRAVSEEKRVLEEAAPISMEDRALVQNFGGTPSEKADYLKSLSKYKDFDFAAYGDEVIARKKGETYWKKLDPGGSLNISQFTSDPMELVRDIADVPYDIASGILSSSAGVGAALPAALGGPVAAAGAGALASGATSAGLEGLRQAIGTSLGMNQIDQDQIKSAGVVGALAPILFGQGATAKQISKAVTKPGAINKLLEQRNFAGFVPEGEAATGAQTEIASRQLKDNMDGVVQRLGSFFSNMVAGTAKPETIENAMKVVNPSLVNALIKDGLELNPNREYTYREIAKALRSQNKMTNFGEMAANTVYGTIENERRKLGDELAAAIDSTGTQIDISDLRKGLETVIENSKNSDIPIIKEQGEAAKKLINKYFAKEPKKVDAYSLSGELIEDLDKWPGAVYDRSGNMIDRRTLRSGNQVLVKAKDAQDISNALSSYIDFTKNPLALDRVDPAERQLRNIMIGAKDTLQDRLYDATGKAGLREQYAKNRDFFRNIYKNFSSPEKSVQTLNTMTNESKNVLRERLRDFDRQYGTNVSELGDLADVAKWFGDPSLEAVSSGGATSTGKIIRTGDLFGSAGYMAGLGTGQPGLAQAGAQIGKSAGSFTSSPWFVDKMLGYGTAARRAGDRTGFNPMMRFIGEQRDSLVPLWMQPGFTARGFTQSPIAPDVAGAAARLPVSVWQLLTGENEK